MGLEKSNTLELPNDLTEASQPFISFVIPAYNEEKYVGHCVRSILDEAKKTDVAIEIIVVNNASTDMTKNIARSFPGVLVVDEPRKGLPAARQAGFLKASGELIAHIDADSILISGWIDKVIKQFRHHRELIALSGPVIFYDLSVWSNIIVRLYYYLAYLSYLCNRFVLRVGSMLQGSNTVIRREALEKIGGYNTTLPFYGEDAELARRLSKIGPVVFTFRLTMSTSGRRFKSEGLFKIGIRYQMNYFWQLLFKKPYSETYTDIRHSEHGNQSTRSMSLNKFSKSLMLTKILLAALTFMLLFGVFRFPLGRGFVSEAHAMTRRLSHMETRVHMHRAFIYTKNKIEKFDFDLDKNS